MDLLRRAQGIGSAVIFDVITHLTETFAFHLEEFKREQRAQEFEQEQLRLRQAAGHNVSDELDRFADLTEAEIKNLGRRQRAKVKGAEKAFDRSEQEMQEEERRRTLQAERAALIQVENQFLRQSLAGRAILQRDQERLEEGLRKVTRSAMSAALNRGETVDQARLAFKRAELAYRTDHGLEIAQELREINATTVDAVVTKDGDDKLSNPQIATPTTVAFMERLRNMYAESSQRKRTGYDLTKPKKPEASEKLPCPIAVPVGDLAQIMKEHVLAIQSDQPWLVAPEASILSGADQSSQQRDQRGSAEEELTKRQREISQKLKRNLELNLRNPSKQVERIRKQTQELPAYQMRDQIVATVRANQVTLISASTGKSFFSTREITDCVWRLTP
jgi:hypothetical protein